LVEAAAACVLCALVSRVMEMEAAPNEVLD